jgi:hypothetical protein
MWDTRIDVLGDRPVCRVTVFGHGALVSYAEVVEQWRTCRRFCIFFARLLALALPSLLLGDAADELDHGRARVRVRARRQSGLGRASLGSAKYRPITAMPIMTIMVMPITQRMIRASNRPAACRNSRG